MSEPEKNSRIIEVTGPSVIKETEKIEKNDNLENLNISKNEPEINIDKEIEKENEMNPSIINMEQKEKQYKDAETQKDENIEKEEIKAQNDINEEKPQNIELTTNNNLSNIMNNNNVDIANLVKSQSYLTSLPLSNNRNKNQIKLNSQNRKTYNYLKEKENSLCMEINAIKQKREQLISFSFENLGQQNVIENNIRESELKKLKKNEINLMEKLEAIKLQNTDLIKNKKK